MRLYERAARIAVVAGFAVLAQFFATRFGTGGLWQGLGATKIEEIVEHVKLEAPEAEPLKLELESFLRAVRGDGDVVVTGAAGLQALALAYRVADAIETSPLASTRP